MLNDFLECAALGIALGDPAPIALVPALRKRGFIDADGDLTDLGYEVAGEAMDFDPMDHHG